MKSCSECEWATCGRLTRHLDQSDLERIEKEKRYFKFSKNQILFSVGQPLNGWFCVQSGRLRNYQVSSNGKEQTFRIIGPGEWFGHREMIEETEAGSNVVAIQEGGVCFIPSRIWGSIMEKPGFIKGLMMSLNDDLKRAEDTMFALGTRRLHSRLAELLLNLEDNDEIVSVTREIMSTMLGSTTETIVRALTDFKDRKWVEVERSRIRLLDKKALKEMAQTEQG